MHIFGSSVVIQYLYFYIVMSEDLVIIPMTLNIYQLSVFGTFKLLVLYKIYYKELLTMVNIQTYTQQNWFLQLDFMSIVIEF